MRTPRAAVAALVAGASALAGVAATAQAAGTPVYLDQSYSNRERAADLVSRMTLAEKASQTISSMSPAIPRLGVPAYGWWNEALHGVSRLQYLHNQNATTLVNTTSYPIDQSLGSSWDPQLVHRVASAIADEAREVAPDNRLNLDFYSPTMNLERDPRWGRNDEAWSEDPLHTTKMASQFVNGMEGKGLDGELLPEANGYYKTLTTIKHYLANNSEVNRRGGSSNMDDRTLREYYGAAFRGVIRESHPGSVMSAYNLVNGTPASADPYLLERLLRETFGFDGYVSSDCDAVREIVNTGKWQPPSWTRPINNTERNAYAMIAGVDLNCNTGYRDVYNYLNQLPTATRQGIQTLMGTFNENDLDTALVRIFEARMKLGEFDDPSQVPWVTQARERVPRNSWKNEEANGAVTETPARLQLARDAGRQSIVLLKNQATKRKDGTRGKLLPLQVPTAGAFKVAVIGQLGNPAPKDVFLGGYSSQQGTAGAANNVTGYQGVRDAITAINPDAQVDFLRGFTGTGTTAADLTTVDQADVAKTAGYDAVVVYLGEDESSSAEDRDRQGLSFPGAQEELAREVAATNPNTVVYMETFGPMDVRSFEPDVAAMLWSSFNGQRKGEALADVLLGTYDPSARVPSTWYRSTTQLPDITNYAITPGTNRPGRTYWYFQGPVSYAFGHGLTYTRFAYRNLQVDHASVDANGEFTVSVDVENTGTLAGADVVQLYVTSPAVDAARPAKRLKAFRKVELAPDETKTVTMTVKAADLAFYDQAAGRWVVDPGTYGIQIARSAADDDIVRQDSVEVTGALDPVPATVTVKGTMAGDAARDVQSRVEFPVGAVVEPRVTVAMSDDALYGAIQKNLSRPLPDGMTVSYASDRPGVVAVGGDGTIRAVGDGVATVTATVAYKGVTREGSFVVRVAGALASLTVDGKPVAGFTADDADYDVVVPESATGVPHVGATASDPGATVEVQQAGAVPGTARVTVRSADGAVTHTSTVYFARPARSDEFDGPTLSPRWNWIRPDASTAGLSNGAFVIRPETGDLNGTTNTAKNLLVQPAAGDWSIESKLDFSALPSVNNQQAGVIAYQDDDNYLRLGLEYSGGTTRLALTTEDNLSVEPLAQPQVLASLPTQSLLEGQKTLWLRLVKTGPRYFAYWSKDGETWRFVYETGAALRDVQIGVFAFNRAGTSSDLRVAFDHVRIANGPTPATTPGGGGGEQPGETVSKPRFVGRTVKVDRKRRATVRIRCGVTTGTRCKGRLLILSRNLVAVERNVSVRADKTAAVHAKVDRQVYRRLVRRHRMKARATLLTWGADGQLRRAAKRLTLVAPRKKR